jgi:hypothetical protein
MSRRRKQSRNAFEQKEMALTKQMKRSGKSDEKMRQKTLICKASLLGHFFTAFGI